MAHTPSNLVATCHVPLACRLGIEQQLCCPHDPGTPQAFNWEPNIPERGHRVQKVVNGEGLVGPPVIHLPLPDRNCETRKIPTDLHGNDAEEGFYKDPIFERVQNWPKEERRETEIKIIVVWPLF